MQTIYDLKNVVCSLPHKRPENKKAAIGCFFIKSIEILNLAPAFVPHAVLDFMTVGD